MGITLLAGANNAGKTTMLQNIVAAFSNVNKRLYQYDLGRFPELIPGLPIDPTNAIVTGYTEWNFLDRRFRKIRLAKDPKTNKLKIFDSGPTRPQSISPEMSSELQIVEKLLPKYFRVSTPIVTVNQYRKLSWHELNGDASQIASALTNLEPNHLTLIGAFVTRLFPEIELLKFGPTDNSGFVEIFVRDRGRDLALSKVGAGIAQAIVLLYATLFAPKDAIVLFDEAFEHLHPSATKEMMRIIAEYSPAYAVVLATHDPAAIRSAYAKQLLHLQRGTGHTIVQTATGDSSLAVVRYLGLENSDLAFASKVLLGEGATEELIFKHLRSRK
jgi:predicted ATP-dependent endonuclease of OLD family